MLAQRLVGLMAHWRESMGKSVAEQQRQSVEELVADMIYSTRDQALPAHSHLSRSNLFQYRFHAKALIRATYGGFVTWRSNSN